MIGTVKLLGAFKGNYIADGFYYANHVLLSHTVGTYRAYISISYIMTALAKPDLGSHTTHNIAEMLHILHLFFKKMKYHAKGCFFTNSWEFCKLVNCIFQ